MSFRLLLDENVEHEVMHRLTASGHDVEHVEFVSELGKGAPDREVATRARETDRLVVTYDDDLVLSVPASAHCGVLLLSDQRMSPREAADVVHEVSTVFDQDQITTARRVGRSWL